jgi:asparagine synthase (glutamine-hydrolysing)
LSGIAGVLNLDGAPIEPLLLRRLTNGLAYRGPDGRSTWSEQAVGFGHARLRTVGAADGPGLVTLDGATWIVADARLDARADLIAQLDRAGTGALEGASDAGLILHAYQRWRHACVEHLLGDYSFAIWDRRERTLLCARDHFGIKPFYYACTGSAFVFSNTLECVLLHPAVDARPSEQGIADFLRFGYNEDPSATSYASVRRLAPAHRLRVRHGAIRSDRYWALPVDARIRYRTSGEYVEHFTDVMERAVSDRLPAGPVGIWMSGGVDSTAIAATARRLDEPRRRRRIRAFTTVYETLIPDDERRFAAMAAEALGIEIQLTNGDRLPPFAGFEHPELLPPEPADDPYFAARLAQLREASVHSRVLLCGEGGDEVLWASDVLGLIGRQPLRHVASDAIDSLFRARRRPGSGLFRALRKWRARRTSTGTDPAWLNRTFAGRFPRREMPEHDTAASWASTLRPEACRRLTSPLWPWYFEAADPGSTRLPLEIRYPFLDVRLVSYVLAIPPLPWCIDKHLVRAAMRGVLPDAIRLRPKSPLREDPVRAYLRAHRSPTFTGSRLGADIDPYVDRAAVPEVPGDTADPWVDSRPYVLDRWLRQVRGRSSVRNATAIAERALIEEAI